MDKFTSFLAPLIQGYIVYRKTSGRWNEASYEPNLLLFDRYCKAHYQNATDLSQQMVDRWCRQRNGQGANTMSEEILVNGNIKIEVLQIKGNTVRLGITAPRDVKVLRGELKPFAMRIVEAELPTPIPVAVAG